MILQIDNEFIRTWERKYDDPKIGGDDKRYQMLIDEVAQDMDLAGTISKKTFLGI
jgi:hypothetical protein